jgi:hypothetical protein
MVAFVLVASEPRTREGGDHPSSWWLLGTRTLGDSRGRREELAAPQEEEMVVACPELLLPVPATSSSYCCPRSSPLPNETQLDPLPYPTKPRSNAAAAAALPPHIYIPSPCLLHQKSRTTAAVMASRRKEAVPASTTASRRLVRRRARACTGTTVCGSPSNLLPASRARPAGAASRRHGGAGPADAGTQIRRSDLRLRRGPDHGIRRP